MNITQLRYFQVVAQEEHYTRATKILNVSQPSLSCAIANLEDELNVPLFQKDGRHVKLTPYGKNFLIYVNEALDKLKAGVDSVQAMSESVSREITVGSLYNMGRSFIPKLLKEFFSVDGNLGVKVTLVQEATKGLLDHMLSDKLNMAFCSDPKSDLFDITPVYEEELVLIVPKSHKLSNYDEINLECLVNENFVLHDRNSAMRDIVEQLLAKANIKPKAVFEADLDTMLCGLVEANHGISILARTEGLKNFDISTIKISHPKFRRFVYLCKEKNKIFTPSAQKFYNFVIKNYIITK